MRALSLAIGPVAGLIAFTGLAAPSAVADPAVPDPGYNAVTYLIGKCWDPSQPVVQEPTTVKYNCDGTSVMQDMAWTSWGAAGATGAGTDSSVECKPDCATGPRLVNPIVVHAWNPRPADGCPPNLQFFADLTVAYPQGVPPWITPGTQWAPDTLFTTVDGMPAVHYVNQSAQSCTPL
jgi:hypothetical protein